jgi:hypothetical protein
MLPLTLQFVIAMIASAINDSKTGDRDRHRALRNLAEH